MKSLTEYERKFGSSPKFVDDFERENAGLASHQVAKSYVAKHPPIQGKKRPPAQRTSSPGSKGASAAAGEGGDYVILGNSNARWPDRGPPGAAAPKTAYRLKLSKTASQPLQSEKKKRQSHLLSAASELQQRQPSKHHRRCKANGKKKTGNKASSSAPPAAGLDRAAAPTGVAALTTDAAVTTPKLLSVDNGASATRTGSSTLPPPSRATSGAPALETLPNTDVNQALRKKAGLPTSISLGGGGMGSGSARSERLFKSEYNREFVAKSLSATPLHSPIMNAEKFYKGSIDLKHYPAEAKETALGEEGEQQRQQRQQPLTEYRKQFPLLPSGVYSRAPSPGLNYNNNNSNDDVDKTDDDATKNENLEYDIISHLPHAASTATALPDPDSAPMSPSGVEFLARTSLPVPHARPSSVSAFNTEYRRSFRPFDAFKYVDGAFKEDENSSPSSASTPPASTPSPPPPPKSWFAEVLELREKAAKYKDRFSSDRFTEVRKKAEGTSDDDDADGGEEDGLLVDLLDSEEEEVNGGGVGGAESAPSVVGALVGAAVAPTDEGNGEGDDDVHVIDHVDDEVDDVDVTKSKSVVPTAAVSEDDLSLHLGGEDEDGEEIDEGRASLSSSVSTLTGKEQRIVSSDGADFLSRPTAASRHSHCDCGASIRSSSSSASFTAPSPPPPPPPPQTSGDPRTTYRSSHRGEKKRLKPNFVPPTIRESMAETYTKSSTNPIVNPPLDDPSFPSPVGPSVPRRPSASRSVPPASETVFETPLRCPSPSESVASSTTSELSARSLSRAEDILQRAKDRRKQFWGD